MATVKRPVWQRCACWIWQQAIHFLDSVLRVLFWKPSGSISVFICYQFLFLFVINFCFYLCPISFLICYQFLFLFVINLCFYLLIILWKRKYSVCVHLPTQWARYMYQKSKYLNINGWSHFNTLINQSNCIADIKLSI